MAASSLIGCLCFFSCTIREEGCLDVVALNFDLDADKNCDGCCQYPPVLVSLSQKWNDQNFSTDSIYLDNVSHPYKIRDLRFVLSAFSWSDLNNKIYTIDSTDINCVQQTVRYTPDIIVVDPLRFLYMLDSIREFPVIKDVEFKLGWLPELSCVDENDETLPDEFSITNPMWDTTLEARSAIRLVVQRELTTEFYDTMFIHTCQEMIIPYDLEFQPAKETRLNLTVNYAQWFKDADISNPASFQSSILSNVQGSFSKTP